MRRAEAAHKPLVRGSRSIWRSSRALQGGFPWRRAETRLCWWLPRRSLIPLINHVAYLSRPHWSRDCDSRPWDLYDESRWSRTSLCRRALETRWPVTIPVAVPETQTSVCRSRVAPETKSSFCRSRVSSKAPTPVGRSRVDPETQTSFCRSRDKQNSYQFRGRQRRHFLLPMVGGDEHNKLIVGE